MCVYIMKYKKGQRNHEEWGREKNIIIYTKVKKAVKLLGTSVPAGI